MRLTSFAAVFVICAVAIGAEEPSERHRLAENLLNAMDMGTQITASFEAMKAVMPAQFEQMQASVPADAKGPKSGIGADQQKKMMDKIMDICAEEMKWENVKPDYINLYSETFSAEELKELIAFYQSPVGKAYLAKQPELMQKSMQLSQKTMMRLMPKIIAMTTESAAEAAPPVPVYAPRKLVPESEPPTDIPRQPVAPASAKESGVSGVFRVAKPEMLMLLSHDGKHLRPLCDVPSHPTIGSPALSPAGDMIACDGNRPGTSYEGTELLLMKADGTEVECLGNGAMPSWSADGKRIAFSCNAPRGVWVLDLATKKRELIDNEGWGIQWSPDGKYWAYSRRGALVVKNVATGEVQEQKSHFGENQLYWGWNMAWSPDCREVCGVVQLQNQNAVAVQSLVLPQAELSPIDPNNGAHRLGRGFIRLFSVGQEINRDVAWHPSGHRIVFTAFLAPADRFQMFEFDPSRDALPHPVVGQTATNNLDQCWSADGKTMVYVAHFNVDEAEPSDAAESR